LQQNNGVKEQMIVESKGKDEEEKKTAWQGKTQGKKIQGICKNKKIQGMDKAQAHDTESKA